MTEKENFVEAFQVIGITTRTSNSEEAAGAGKISSLWNQFYTENLLAKIPGRTDTSVLAIYHTYESDANGPYSVTIGTRVISGPEIPPGMTLLSLPAQNYAQFTSAKGTIPEIVLDVWKNIWNLTTQAKLKRKYSYDIEMYDERSANPKSAEIDVWIAIE